jgi:hypothetical protein
MLTLTLPRIVRLLATCRTPAAASRASERVYRLRHNARPAAVNSGLEALSGALNEHRHMLLATFRGDIAATGEHARNRNAEVQYALRQFARAA